ncbi:CBS domain-containing protein [Actinacidiphila bryophytorum]|uniref:Hypoxic response protein 1 n=1 Tax=Actinacidiphila bryophytorum TaxID=1436133 RepID=A0A9W4E494_9ACTN|nr:CBS domain-containing protein [Actinacidiphila bryophytorum]MBM9438409.1 CBS domain-containing protein [Actinacidiphila bryophytorum]MBN6542317.1 CBS domain-containing protein [Actinacidiphila bryophytorum]CAG7613894.1 Hypoxic response protein 1 [Actinacidiphila bryophytorum]
MRHRNVSDLMTHSVFRVRSDTHFKEIAKVLADHDITAVPVVDDSDRPLGMVSEADLLRRESSRPDPAGLLSDLDTPGEESAGPVATTAGGLMSSPAIIAHPEWSVVQAARVMDRGHVKRLPVVDEIGRLIGIVSRADLLRVFLRRDNLIREEITGDILDRSLGIGPDAVSVQVTDGRVHLRGTVDRRSLIAVVVRLCEGVDGVVDVTTELDYRTDEASAVAGHGRDRIQP